MRCAAKAAPPINSPTAGARGAPVLFSHMITIVQIVVQMQSGTSAPVRLPPRASARAGPQAPFCLLFPILSEQLSQSFRAVRALQKRITGPALESAPMLWRRTGSSHHREVVTQRQRSLHK